MLLPVVLSWFDVSLLPFDKDVSNNDVSLILS